MLSSPAWTGTTIPRDDITGFPEAEERAHMNHPDFRVGGKNLCNFERRPDASMAKLTPEQQQNFLRTETADVRPSADGAGRTRSDDVPSRVQ